MMLTDDCFRCPAQRSCHGGYCFVHKVGFRNAVCQFWQRAAHHMETNTYVQDMLAKHQPPSVIDPADADLYDDWAACRTFEDALAVVQQKTVMYLN